MLMIPTTDLRAQRIRVFIWLVHHRRILTNLERSRRSLTYDPSYPICREPESVIHILRDCRDAKNPWLRIIPAAWHGSFFSSGLDECLFKNLQQSTGYDTWNCSWFHIFSSVMWQLWKRRNSLAWARHFSSTYCLRLPQTRSAPRLIHWERPPPGWICINCDGVVSKTNGLSIAGGVLRDSNGRWLLGFTRFTGHCSPLQAELSGLTIACNRNFSLVLIQSDSLEAVKLISSSNAGDTRSQPLVRSILSLRQRQWITDVKWIPHEANSVADALSKPVVLLQLVPLFMMFPR
ncbi:hypothetical protein F3Y22_tig00002237pilonHSYRG01574 [Hibiscus syriacus]|uniref:RNase H type-1 domain-containing protein n=1 Tax=Hibiscus syriacus TaxID=106335 RepID=A0A6A3CUW5_HIBSY|nr:hypothetical protein F3Y22_tig00002237pilonHSYRG01574 [Hibiscus syriacus]